MTLRIPTFRRGNKSDGTRYGANRLYRDAASLASSSMVNAVFGMVVWAITARLIAPAQLGIMSAVLSAVTTAAIAVANTTGDAFIALLPASGRARRTIFLRGRKFYLIGSTVAGVIAGISTVQLISEVRGSVAVLILVTVGTVLLGSYLLQNLALTSIGRASWLMPSAVSMNLFRIALLFAFALTFKWHSLELSLVISAGTIGLILNSKTSQIIRTSDSLPQDSLLTRDEAVREFDRFLPRSFLATSLGYAIFFLTPFLVTAFSGPTQGALFALSLPLAQTLDFVSTSMGTSLAVHASANPGDALKMARSVLLRALPIAAFGAVGIAVFGPLVLRQLNPQYGSMGAFSVIAMLCGASVFRTPFSVWAGLQRSRRNLRPMLVVAFLGACVAVIAVSLLSRAFGALGGALGLSLAYLVLSIGAGAHLVFVQRRSVRSTSPSEIRST